MTSDPGPMARFEDVKRDINAPAEIFSRLTDADTPSTLPEIAKAWRVPRGKFVEWFTTVHRATYDSALKVLTDGLAFEALKIADGVEGEEEAAKVAAAKLRIDTRLRTAARWDRERYGEREAPQTVVNVNFGDVAREIRDLEARLGIGAVVPQALPAPSEVEDAQVVAPI